MRIQIHAYMIPRSYQVLSVADRADLNEFFENRIDEALALDPVNAALSSLLPIAGRVRVHITWCVNDTTATRSLIDLNWGDIDNVAKPIIDRLQGRVIKDDRQIVQLVLNKRSLRDFNTDSRRHMGYASVAGRRAIERNQDFVFIEVTEETFNL